MVLQQDEVDGVHGDKVESGFFQDVYADSNLNGDYKSRRKICTLVPPGYNSYDDPNLCEAASVQGQTVAALVERFNIEPFSDFLAK